MISKKELEILLESCESFQNPKASLEQYLTPAPIAADLINLAYLKGDLKGKNVFDLGCGTGRLAIGASLFGARDVTGFDVDCPVLETAKDNAQRLKARVNWQCTEVSSIAGVCDTVVQNPPFGVKNKGADRPFITKALETGKVIYTMHKTTTRGFIEGFVNKLGGKITDKTTVKFALPKSYDFHKKRIKRIDVDIYRIERRD
jgi:putative methylase